MRIRALFAALSVVVALAGSQGCASAPPNLGPVAHQAFYNTRAIKGLDLLRDFAVDGNAEKPPIISTATTRKVVLCHESTVKIIHAAGSGWQAAALAGLDELPKDVPADEAAKLRPYLVLTKTILSELP